MPEKLTQKLKKNTLPYDNIKIPKYNTQYLQHTKLNKNITLLLNLDPKEDEDIKEMTLEEFQKLATGANEPLDIDISDEEIGQKIKEFFASAKKRAKSGEGAKNMTLYASDVNGYLFSNSLTQWNINQFTEDDSLLHKMPKKEWVEGVHHSYLYIGTDGSAFNFHVEDQNANSINYLHAGSPKIWYCVAEKNGKDMEKICNDALRSNADYKNCDQPMRHKTCFIDRQLLENVSFTVTEIVQRAGQFVITWCGAYHGGFNSGFNIAEASNFGAEEWREVGKKFVDCDCPEIKVQIDENERPNFDVAKILRCRGPYAEKEKLPKERKVSSLFFLFILQIRISTHFTSIY